MAYYGSEQALIQGHWILKILQICVFDWSAYVNDEPMYAVVWCIFQLKITVSAMADAFIFEPIAISWNGSLENSTLNTLSSGASYHKISKGISHHIFPLTASIRQFYLLF